MELALYVKADACEAESLLPWATSKRNAKRWLTIIKAALRIEQPDSAVDVATIGTWAQAVLDRATERDRENRKAVAEAAHKAEVLRLASHAGKFWIWKQGLYMDDFFQGISLERTELADSRLADCLIVPGNSISSLAFPESNYFVTVGDFLSQS